MASSLPLKAGFIATALLCLAGCDLSPTPPQSAPIASTALAGEARMLGYAATDFKTHVALSGAEFRSVRLGVRTLDGEHAQVLCGEFRAPPQFDSWTAFGVLQTDPYENWLGVSNVCNPAYTVLRDEDLTAKLTTQYAKP
jgi:hypothetical protein